MCNFKLYRKKKTFNTILNIVVKLDIIEELVRKTIHNLKKTIVPSRKQSTTSRKLEY